MWLQFRVKNVSRPAEGARPGPCGRTGGKDRFIKVGGRGAGRRQKLLSWSALRFWENCTWLLKSRRGCGGSRPWPSTNSYQSYKDRYSLFCFGFFSPRHGSTDADREELPITTHLVWTQDGTRRDLETWKPAALCRGDVAIKWISPALRGCALLWCVCLRGKLSLVVYSWCIRKVEGHRLKLTSENKK